MKKTEERYFKLAIGLICALIVAGLIFAEYGVASVFDLRINGLTYVEYTKAFFRDHPYYLWIEIIVFVGVIIGYPQYAYRELYGKNENIEE